MADRRVLTSLLVALAVTATARGQELTLPADDPVPAADAPAPGPAVWGVAGFRGVYAGERVAPNGVPFDPVFSLDLNFNLWLWRTQGLYLFTDLRFWGQRAAPGITNDRQAVDFSKREFDFDLGGAWNYAGPLEFRAFGYSMNNLNRGAGPVAPAGFKDGFGVENRLYLSPEYRALGTADFDVARADFVSLGYLPTKSIIGLRGQEFTPSAFARAYLTHDLWTDALYAYVDVTLTTQKPITPKLLTTDAGLAVRPFARAPRLECRAGCETPWDLQDEVARPLGYLSVRYVY